MAYRSREQIEKETAYAKSCDIIRVANTLGYELIQHGHSFQDRNDSTLVFFTNTNSYYDYYGHKGGSPIDFVMDKNSMSIGEAIKFINEQVLNLSFDNSSVYTPVEKTNYQTKSMVMPEKNDNHKRVFAYLSKSRGIASDIVSDMLHKHLIYEEAVKHNAVFVGVDKENNPKHCFIRGTITGVQYRGDSYGSDKNYGFKYLKELDRLVVFEAPIDLLSYMTLYPNDNSSLLALGMLSAEPIYQFLNDYDVKQISFMLDNDEPGFEATKKFTEELKNKGYSVIENNVVDLLKTNDCKDINELLVKKKNINEVQNHEGLNK